MEAKVIGGQEEGGSLEREVKREVKRDQEKGGYVERKTKTKVKCQLKYK